MAPRWTKRSSLAGGARKEGAPVRCPVSLSVGQAGPQGWVTVTVATSRGRGRGNRVLLRRGRAGRTDHMSGGAAEGVHQWKPSLGARPTTTQSGTSGPSDKSESQDEDNHCHSPPSPSPSWRWPCPPGNDQIILPTEMQQLSTFDFMKRILP